MHDGDTHPIVHPSAALVLCAHDHMSQRRFPFVVSRMRTLIVARSLYDYGVLVTAEERRVTPLVSRYRRSFSMKPRCTVLLVNWSAGHDHY